MIYIFTSEAPIVAYVNPCGKFGDDMVWWSYVVMPSRRLTPEEKFISGEQWTSEQLAIFKARPSCLKANARPL